MPISIPIKGDALRLADARTKAGEAETFDEMLKVVLDELKHWPPGTTNGFRNEIADLLRTAGDRGKKMAA